MIYKHWLQLIMILACNTIIGMKTNQPNLDVHFQIIKDLELGRYYLASNPKKGINKLCWVARQSVNKMSKADAMFEIGQYKLTTTQSSEGINILFLVARQNVNESAQGNALLTIGNHYISQGNLIGAQQYALAAQQNTIGNIKNSANTMLQVVSQLSALSSKENRL